MAEEEYKKLNEKLDGLKLLVIATSKEVLTVEECAVLTGLSTSHIYRLTSGRNIPFYKPMSGKIYFKKSEIENWLLQGRQSTNAEIRSAATTYCVTHK